MKEKLIDILSNIRHGKLMLLPTWMIEPLADALVNTGVVLRANPDVIYICDEEACEECQIDGDGRYCYHTSDIRHATNFEEVSPGCWAEKVGPKDDKDARIQELEKELRETRDILNRAYKVVGHFVEKYEPCIEE